MRWTEPPTLLARTHARDEDFAAMQSGFEPKQIVHLTIAIGPINARNRLSIGTRLPAPEDR